MKKTIFLILLFFVGVSANAQLLTENFDTSIPATWTITDAGAATGDSWASGTIGGQSLDGTNAAFVNSDANGNGTLLLETLTSPVFDASGASNLIFEFDQYYQNLGSSGIVEVYDGTTWVEVLNQTATVGAFDAPDTQIINLTAYSNANMQIRFVYNDGDNWAWYWLIDNVKVSNVACPAPLNVNISNITDLTAQVNWSQGGSETTWDVAVQPQGTGTPTAGWTSETSPYTITGLTATTDYEVYVRSTCGGADGNSDWVGPVNFTTNVQTTFIVDCAAAPLDFNYCYPNNDTNLFTFTTTTGFPVTITFNSGTVEDNWDEFIVFDTDGTQLTPTNYYGNGGDLSGLTYTSTGDTLQFQITSDFTASCANGASQTPINATVICQTCIKPNVTFTTNGDCAANPDAPEFFIDVDIIDFGSVTSVQVVDDQGNPGQLPTAPGVLTFGPYPAGQNVIIEVSTDDVNCIEYSDPLTVVCPAPPNECSMIYAGPDQTLDCGDTTADLQASFQVTGQDFNFYEINALSSCPTPPISGGTPTSLEIDDRWSDVVDMEFDFCFFGDTYNKIIVGANGGLSFDISNAGQPSGWSFTEEIPNATSTALTDVNIFAAYHDINPQTCGDINYSVLGSAPSRQFVVNYNEVCQFSCTTQLASMQVILYEGSNNIDINVFNKPQCSAWNNGSAVIGIQNMASDTAFFPAGRNTGDWEAVDEFYRFSPGQSATPNYFFEWYDDNGIYIDNTAAITVTPTQTTTYTATMTYSQCAGPNITVSDTVTITVPEGVTLMQPADINVCDDDNDGFSEYDLTSVEAVLLNGQTGLTVTYHNTLADAEAGLNPIANSTAYTNVTANTETIYIRVVNPMSGCFETETVVLNSLSNPMASIDTNIAYEVCPNATQPISISATASNFNVSDVTIQWDLDGAILSGETNLDINTVLTQGDYTITVTDNTTMCFSTETITVIELDSCVIPQGISPNNDGKNDRFDLSSYDVQSLKIYNRNGKEVFVKENGYKDEWFGQSDNGDELPTGTYYYIMRYKGDQVKASYVYINR